MSREMDMIKAEIPSRRKNVLEVNKRIFPDKKIERWSHYELKDYAGHVFLTPSATAHIQEYSFTKEYYKPEKRKSDTDMAGDFLIMMNDLHCLLGANISNRCPYGICDPNKVELLTECGNVLLRFVNRYGLFGLFTEISVQNDMLSYDANGQPQHIRNQIHPIIGSKRFKQFLLNMNFDQYGLSADFFGNLDLGFMTGADYRKLFMPWIECEEVLLPDEFLEEYSEDVAILLNSDVFMAAYYNTVLRDIREGEDHHRFLEYQGGDDEPSEHYISRFDEIRAEDLIVGHIMLQDPYPTDDNFDSLLPVISERLQKYLTVEVIDGEPINHSYDFYGYFNGLKYINVDIAEFEEMCEMIEPSAEGGEYRLRDNYQISHSIGLNSEKGKWDFIITASSLIGMILNRRMLDLVYNNIETRICAKPGCGKSFTKQCYQDKRYCSKKCATADRVRRHRARNKRLDSYGTEETNED